MKDSILSFLSPNYPWTEYIEYHPTIGSTNDQLKALAKQGAPHGSTLIAGHQTCGHGRMGRSFHSPEGMGIYLSILLRPDCVPSDLMHLTCAAAVVMCDAVEKAAGFRPGIKWTNDLVCEGRKLGGILTELSFSSSGKVDYAIVGIGINCHQKKDDFPEEIQNIATSVDMTAKKRIDSAFLAAAMLESLQHLSESLLTEKEMLLERYRRDCITIGREISILRADTIRYGKAVHVDNDGALVVIYQDGSMEAVNAGEVSIRGMYGYV